MLVVCISGQDFRPIRGKHKKTLAKNRERLCCLGRIRTLTGGTRIRRATITPQGKVSCRFDVAKVRTFFEPTNLFPLFFRKKLRSPAIKCVTHLLPETCLVYFIGYIVWCIRCHACTPDNNALRYAHIGNACLYPHLLVPQDVQMRQPS